MIQALGLVPDSPDWQKVGFDLADPADSEAFARLHQRRVQIVKAREQK